MINGEVANSEDVKERLSCQLNLLKLQTVIVMKALDERMIEMADTKVDFLSKIKETRFRKANVTPRKDGGNNTGGESSRS